MERSWLKEIVPKIQEKFFCLFQHHGFLCWHQCLTFIYTLPLKKKEVIPYTTCYITFQLLVRIDRVNKLAECFISTDIQIHTSFNTTFKNRHFKY